MNSVKFHLLFVYLAPRYPHDEVLHMQKLKSLLLIISSLILSFLFQAGRKTEYSFFQAWSRSEYSLFQVWSKSEYNFFQAWSKSEYSLFQAWNGSEYSIFQVWNESEYSLFQAWSKSEYTFVCLINCQECHLSSFCLLRSFSLLVFLFFFFLFSYTALSIMYANHKQWFRLLFLLLLFVCFMIDFVLPWYSWLTVHILLAYWFTLIIPTLGTPGVKNDFGLQVSKDHRSNVWFRGSFIIFFCQMFMCYCF